MKNKMTIIISVVAVIVVAGALLLVFNPFSSSASAAESTPAVNASPDTAPTPAFAPAAAATDSTSAMLSAPASESNDEIIALFNNTFDTAHEDNRLPAEYDAWTDYEFVVMHDLVFKGEFNLDGIALQELDSAYLLWREENYAEAEDKIFEKVDIIHNIAYIKNEDGSDIFDYYGEKELMVITHLDYNSQVSVKSVGIKLTSAEEWTKVSIKVWDADLNRDVWVIAYIKSSDLSDKPGPDKPNDTKPELVSEDKGIVISDKGQLPTEQPVTPQPDGGLSDEEMARLVAEDLAQQGVSPSGVHTGDPGSSYIDVDPNLHIGG